MNLWNNVLDLTKSFPAWFQIIVILVATLMYVVVSHWTDVRRYEDLAMQLRNQQLELVKSDKGEDRLRGELALQILTVEAKGQARRDYRTIQFSSFFVLVAVFAVAVLLSVWGTIWRHMRYADLIQRTGTLKGGAAIPAILGKVKNGDGHVHLRQIAQAHNVSEKELCDTIEQVCTGWRLAISKSDGQGDIDSSIQGLLHEQNRRLWKYHLGFGFFLVLVLVSAGIAMYLMNNAVVGMETRTLAAFNRARYAFYRGYEEEKVRVPDLVIELLQAMDQSAINGQITGAAQARTIQKLNAKIKQEYPHELHGDWSQAIEKYVNCMRDKKGDCTPFYREALAIASEYAAQTFPHGVAWFDLGVTLEYLPQGGRRSPDDLNPAAQAHLKAIAISSAANQPKAVIYEIKARNNLAWIRYEQALADSTSKDARLAEAFAAIQPLKDLLAQAKAVELELRYDSVYDTMATIFEELGETEAAINCWKNAADEASQNLNLAGIVGRYEEQWRRLEQSNLP